MALQQDIPATFQAYIYTSFGATESELKLRRDLPQPLLGASQVRVKVLSAALNPADWKLIEHGAQIFPVSPTEDAPFRVGFDAAGTIVELGTDVADFQVGDAVYLMTPFTNIGTVGEYLVANAQFVARKPSTLTFDEAASVPAAALTSYQALVTHAKVQRGERVLILGGSGGTGVFAVQIAKALGAHVTATTSFRNTEFVKSLGADQVIDYTASKWADVLPPHLIDVIYDCGVEPASWNTDAQKVLKRDGTGRFVTLQPLAEHIVSPIGASFKRMVVEASSSHLEALATWIEDGKVRTVIDSVYEFEDLLAGLARVKSERSRGKVVVHVAATQRASERDVVRPHDKNRLHHWERM